MGILINRGTLSWQVAKATAGEKLWVLISRAPLYRPIDALSYRY
jgi:hypothetical protein